MSSETPISPPVIPRTISGFTLTPLVSSSKNLNRPALEAGKGAFFFLLIRFRRSCFSFKYIPFTFFCRFIKHCYEYVYVAVTSYYIQEFSFRCLCDSTERGSAH